MIGNILSLASIMGNLFYYSLFLMGLTSLGPSVCRGGGFWPRAFLTKNIFFSSWAHQSKLAYARQPIHHGFWKRYGNFDDCDRTCDTNLGGHAYPSSPSMILPPAPIRPTQTILITYLSFVNANCSVSTHVLPSVLIKNELFSCD